MSTSALRPTPSVFLFAQHPKEFKLVNSTRRPYRVNGLAQPYQSSGISIPSKRAAQEYNDRRQALIKGASV